MSATGMTPMRAAGRGIPQAGQSFRAADAGIVILVLSAPSVPGTLCCDGAEMVPTRPLRCSYLPQTGAELGPGWLLREQVSGLEVRCVRGGSGHISYGGRALTAF
jgi:hypothetical protein